jgi:hypothetical protein
LPEKKKGWGNLMMILAHAITNMQDDKKEHAIAFEFGNKNFEVVVIEENNQTYVAESYLMFGRGSVEIDIPEYFGRGFSHEVFSFIYSKADNISNEEDEE